MNNGQPKTDNKKQEGSTLNNLLGKAKNFVGKIWTGKQAAGEKNKADTDRLEELLQSIQHTEKHPDKTIVPEEQQKDWLEDVKFIVTKGFYDGVNRQYSGAAAGFAESKAGELWLRFTGWLDGKDKTLEKEAASVSEVLTGKRKQAELHRDYENYLQHHNKFNERGNTLGEFFLYLGCCIVIFLADIPLAAEMLKYLYGVSAKKPPITFSNIGDNMGTFISAIGIGFSSIYIKIWYDEFVAKKFGHSVISRKKFEELFQKKNETGMPDRPLNNTISSPASMLDEDDMDEIKKNDRFVKRIKITILFFTLLTITMLGVFRGFAWRQANVGGVVPVFVISATLITITLLFSVVSGISLSVSLSAFTNYNRLKKIKQESIELEEKYVKATKELAAIEGQRAYVCKVKAEVNNGQAWKSDTLRILLAYYRTGFDAGMAEPGYLMNGLDYFDRIVLWREKFIAKNSNQQIINP